MEQTELRKWEAQCTQEEPPRCRAGCPLNIDARAFVQAMAGGNLQQARAVLEKSMPLVQITASLCEAPCEKHCLRKDHGGSIAIGLLERKCLSSTVPKSKPLRLPPKAKNAAVLGAGPASLVCAGDLSRKGYPVTVIYTGRIGGWLSELPEDQLPAQRLEAEITNLQTAGVIFQQVEKLDKKLTNNLTRRFNALFIDCDQQLPEEIKKMTEVVDSATGATGNPEIFSGPATVKKDSRYIDAAAAGKEAAISMDRFLQGASLSASRVFPRHGHTELYTETADVSASPRIIPDSGDYTTEEALSEAARCLDCQCLECVRHCRYLEKFKGYPKIYARQIYNNEAIVKGSHQANKLINSCSLCGQCEVLCPNDFSMADLCLQARQKMVAESRMPPSAHYFALEEMRSALSSSTVLCSHAPGTAESSTIFFPGCQLSGTRPDQVLALYQHLLQQTPKTGIWLTCCAAPAHWSGRKEEICAIADTLRKQWLEMGQPAILCACSSCLQMLQIYLPEIKAASVWSALEQLPDGASPHDCTLAVTDPCTARHDHATQSSVRNLLTNMNQPQSSLAMSGERTECCGYGGLMANANPEIATEVGRSRGTQSENPLLTYCIMCREQLQRAGTPSLHLLDLLFPETARSMNSPPVSLSDRRYNREMLAAKIRTEWQGEPASPAPAWSAISLKTDEELQAVMEKRRILEQDIKQVLHHAENTGCWLDHQTTGDRVASKNFGEVTVWVHYTQQEKTYIVKSVWSHRMQIGRIV